MAARVNYTRKHTYRTRSNQVRKLKTPGGRLTIQYMRKVPSHTVCGETGVRLQGVVKQNKNVANKLAKRRRTVSRPYGGVLSAEAVKYKIMRAFFNEEFKVIKQSAQSKRAGKKRAARKQK